ncbi:MAG: Lrp/AsnC family transcriptional regulator [Candidatus Hodarchaeota archaeon]
MTILSTDKILEALRENSRKSFLELGDELNVSDTAIRKRVMKLKEEGVIKFTIEVDPKKLGYDLTSFIGFDVKANYFISVIEELKSWIQIQSIFQTSLDHDFLMECWFRDNDDLTNFIKKLESLNGITRVCPATVIQRIK